MLRPVSLLPALAAVATLTAAAGALPLPAGGPLPVAPASASASAASLRADDTEPLQVSIDTIPSQLPRRGPVRVSGSITNLATEPWRDIRVYAFMSSTPITSVADLADAAATPATAQVGERIIDLGAEDAEQTVDRLEPGESAQFSLTVPHRDLTITSAGVYWFGVHALGAGPDGRVDGADGRARTFLPYVPPTRKSVDAALVLPVRRLVAHRPDGSIARLGRWTTDLAAGGALRSLVDLGVSAGDRPVTWLVDPAVVEAVRRIAAGNPGRDLGPTVDDGDRAGDDETSPAPTEGSPSDPGPDGSADPSTTASPDPSPDATGSADQEGGDGDSNGDGNGDGGEDLTPTERAAAAAAATWLERLHVGLTDTQVLALPFGDVDVSAAAELDPSAYREARERSGDRLAPWDLPMSPAVAPAGGFLDPTSLRIADRATTVLVSDRMLDAGDTAESAGSDGTPGSAGPTVVRTRGRRLVVTSSGAASGGPGPDWPLSPIAVRQRIVSEAALRLLSGGREPLVVALPDTWSPSPAPGFFPGLDLPWLHLTDVAGIRARRAAPLAPDRLRYPHRREVAELGPARFAAAEALTASGHTLQKLLTLNDAVGGEVRDEALADLSYAARHHPLLTARASKRSRAWIERRLHAVRINAPRAVILSSGRGRFAAIVTNRLPQPVSLRVKAVAEPPLKVSVAVRTVELGPTARTTIPLNASSSAIGIRTVTLVLTDLEGVPLGSSDAVPIRSNRVSNVIWLIIGTGVTLLLLAIVVRLVRRIRTARRGADLPPTEDLP